MIKLQLHENWQLCNIRQLGLDSGTDSGDIMRHFLRPERCRIRSFGDNEYQAKADGGGL